MQDVGELSDNTFCLNTKTSGLLLYIPSSTNYRIEGVDFKLSYLENDTFEKSIYLKYNKDNKSSISHALWYLNGKNTFSEEKISKPDNTEYIYKISKIGNFSEVSQLGKDIFGENNSFSYESENYNFSIHNSTKTTDYVRLSKILTGENENIPINYIINPNDICTVKSLEYTIGKRKIKVKEKPDSGGNINIKLSKSDFDLTCSGENINQINVIFAFSIALAVLICVICIIIYINRKNFKK